MSHFRSISRVGFGLFLIVLIFCSTSYGNCVQCTPNTSGWVCTSNDGAGGTGCRTPDLFTCTLIGICFPNGDRPSPDGNPSACQLRPTKNPFVSIEDSLIREIGSQDARLALAALSIRATQFEFFDAKTSFFSVKYGSLDVENQLKAGRDSAYSSELESRVSAARSSDSSVFTYRMTIIDSPSGSTLSIVPDGFEGNSLNITLAPRSSMISSFDGYRAVKYELR